MGHIDPARVAARVSELLDLPVSAEAVGNTGQLAIRLIGLDRPHGFEILAKSGLSFVYANLVLDSLARPLLQAAQSSTHESWEQFFATLGALHESGFVISAKLNQEERAELPAVELNHLELSGKALDWLEDAEKSLAQLCAATISVILTVLPLDRHPESGTVLMGYEEEGQRSWSMQSKYERSRSNRAVAILVHGVRCKSCGFDFGESYGAHGAGYIEIHHRVPLHLMEGPRPVNPVEELVPLCANCHRMVHRVDPPLTPEELRGILENQTEALDDRIGRGTKSRTSW